jgi:soluble lytic murein transglycosylase-like protein
MKNRIKKHKNKFILLTAILSTLLASPTLTLAKSKLGKKKKSSVSNQKLINLSDAIYNVGFKNREQGYMLAQLILNESQKSHIDPNLLVAIIMVESSFNQNAISTTGDLSLAQINVPIWNA